MTECGRINEAICNECRDETDETNSDGNESNEQKEKKMKSSEFRSQHFHNSRGVGACSSNHHKVTYKDVLAHKGYLVQQTLGSGTYSKVKLAVGTNNRVSPGMKVAVKIVDRQRAPLDYQSKFLPRELSIWPTLQHPHIAPLLDVFRDSRRVYMVLPYAPGGDVLTFVQQYGAPKEAAALRWMCQVTSAVRYLHGKGITHRDLKLENLLIDPNGNLLLCDFGFVRQDKDPMDSLSRTYCGSKSYASPEILHGSTPYDPRKSDIWAIGVITYILVTGRMPFDESKGTKSVLSEQKSLSFRWPHGRQISKVCRSAIHKMFTWDFRKRPNIDQLLTDPWFVQGNAQEEARQEVSMETDADHGGNGDQK